jgi:hypothetical protein
VPEPEEERNAKISNEHVQNNEVNKERQMVMEVGVKQKNCPIRKPGGNDPDE